MRKYVTIMLSGNDIHDIRKKFAKCEFVDVISWF